MKILCIHANSIEFTAKKKAFKQAEEGVEKGTSTKVEECLVIFTAVEKRDEENVSAVINKYLREIKNIAQQLDVKNIVLYPYAHLSPDLSNPKVAEDLMKQAEKTLIEEKYSTYRAPFGWYKSFDISTKGHPMSELSREFGPEDSAKKDNLKREYTDVAFAFQEEELTKDQQYNLTTALIVAKAIQSQFREAKVGSLGFYHDQAFVDMSGVKLHQEDIKRIEKQMGKIINAKLLIQRGDRQKINTFQQDILKDVGQEKPVFELDDLSVVPLFKDPFVSSTKEIGAFKIVNLGSAYWKGNEKNQQLTRINCVGFSTPAKLEEFIKKREAAEARSHLKIGKEQDLFVVSPLVGAGLPLLAPKGNVIRRQIVQYLWDLHKNHDYQWVWTPHIAKKELYQTSGHWDKFGDELFHVKGKHDDFVMKPMNCPHHMQIFDSFSLSYRDMPIRFFEPATVYRDEKSGQLIGLSRVRAITQDDGHLFCRVSQIKQEVSLTVKIIVEFFKTLGMKADWVSLSVRGEDKSKYLGEDKNWEIAELSLEEVAKDEGLECKRILGEAAFYGPKLDFMFTDALGRELQLSTIQLDFNMPERFDLGFMSEKGLKERPVVIHRAISGSLERFMAVLIEHFAGKFPLWLSPVQVKILTITDRSNDFANELMRKLKEKDIRVILDTRSESMGRKIRDAQLEQVNYIITIGDKEVENRNLAIRTRDGKERRDVAVSQFVDELVKEIKGKVL